MPRYEIIKLNKCEECEYRQNQNAPNFTVYDMDDGDHFRCYHPNEETYTDILATVQSHKALNNYTGDFPSWCPLFDFKDALTHLKKLK